MSTSLRIVVIGAGFFGLFLAEHFARAGNSVLVIEKESRAMARASYANQARVHNGYHYPRSILTALRSRLSFPHFVAEFRDCVVSDFDKYYMIGKPLGKVSDSQFRQFCLRIGATCNPAPLSIQRLTNPSLIEGVYSTVEFAFDAVKLEAEMANRLDSLGVERRFGTSAERVWRNDPMGDLMLRLVNSKESFDESANHVFNCTYSRINYLLDHSGLELIPFKHEMTEMALVDVPEPLKRLGITVMCGPFFSVMPFPSKGLHSFSHVRYTPHYEWHDRPGSPYVDADHYIQNHSPVSAWRYMQKDAARYIPLMEECHYKESLWEVKTLLPRSETDDSRPILFRPNQGLAGFHCLMGGKIDNVYDAVRAIGLELGL